MNTTLKPLLLAALVVLAHAPAAKAEMGTSEQRSACMGDVMRFCSSEIPNMSRIVACLERNKSQVSAKCRAFRPAS